MPPSIASLRKGPANFSATDGCACSLHMLYTVRGIFAFDAFDSTWKIWVAWPPPHRIGASALIFHDTDTLLPLMKRRAAPARFPPTCRCAAGNAPRGNRASPAATVVTTAGPSTSSKVRTLTHLGRTYTGGLPQPTPAARQYCLGKLPVSGAL